MLRITLAATSVCIALASSSAFAAKTCDVSIEGTDAMQFSTKELSVGKECTEIKVTLKHAGKLPKTAMGHNWVLAKDSDMPGIVTAGMAAGVVANYVPVKEDVKKLVIASTALVGGGESASTTFKASDLKAGVTYKYFCTFPGHSAVMQGTFSIK